MSLASGALSDRPRRKQHANFDESDQDARDPGPWTQKAGAPQALAGPSRVPRNEQDLSSRHPSIRRRVAGPALTGGRSIHNPRLSPSDARVLSEPIKAGCKSGLPHFLTCLFTSLTIRHAWDMAAQADRFRRSSGSAAQAFRPGHLFWMTAGATWLNQDKPRPFALATPCRENEVGTLVYGSTQGTERSAGAACVGVAPVREGLHRNGLRSTTYFYPGTLLPAPHEDLPPQSGFLGRSLSDLRATLRIALGIGTGSCRESGAPWGSLRGRIVVLDSTLAHDIGASVAVVLTEPRYSAKRNYQIILPIFDGLGREPAKHDLLVSSRDWLEVFPATVDRVVLLLPTTHSVWHDNDIARETEYVVDDETLSEIDRRLCDYFSLPLHDRR